MNTNELVTKADIIAVKEEIILQIKELLGQAAPKQMKLLRSRDVMKLLSISASGLQNLRVNSIIPFKKIGGTIYYQYDDIIALLDKKKAV